MQIGDSIEVLASQWAEVPYSGASPRFVLGDVRPHAEILLIGEAPGEEEDREGRAFVGRAGSRLNVSSERAGLLRDQISIGNVFPRRPDNNREPTAEEIKLHSPYVDRLVRLHPNLKAVGLMGGSALMWKTGQEKIKSYRGCEFERDGLWWLPMFHPAAILYRPSELKWLVQDLGWIRTLAAGGLLDTASMSFDLVETGAALRPYFPGILDSPYSYVDIETASEPPANPLWWWDGRVRAVLFSFGWFDEGGQPRAVVVRANEGTLPAVKELLESGPMHWCGSSALYFDVPMLDRIGIRVACRGSFLDTLPIAKLNDENRGLGAKDLAKQHLRAIHQTPYWGEHEEGQWHMRWGQFDSMSDAERLERVNYSGKDAWLGVQTVKAEADRLRTNARLVKAYRDIIVGGQSRAIAEMQRTGLPLDLKAAAEMSERLGTRMAEVDAMLQETVPDEAKPVAKSKKSRRKAKQGDLGIVPDPGEPVKRDTINFSSSAQVSRLLFGQAGIPPVKTTPSGDRASADRFVLMKCLDHEDSGSYPEWAFKVIHGVLELRELEKAKGYVDSLIDAAGVSFDGRVHSTLKIGPVTWRIACVPLDAEILTVEGWKLWHDVTLGEQVVGYNVLTGQLVITELHAVHRGLEPVGKLSYMHGPTRSIGIRCTANHKWVAESSRIRGYVAADASKRRDRLILGSGTPATWTLDDSIDAMEAAIIGWAITDGHIDEVSAGRFRLAIEVRKPSSITALDQLLALTPHTRRAYEHRRTVRFALSTEVFSPMWARATKRGLVEYVVRLSPQARQSMWDAMMEADGSVRRYGGGRSYERFGAAKRAVIDAFQALGALQGKAIRYRWRLGRTRPTGRKPFMDMEVSGHHQHPRWQPSAGVEEVWCPETGTGTWVMRQNGVVCITGNSEDPNVQQLQGEGTKYPVKTLFVAPAGWKFVKHDYKALEVCGLADQSGDPKLIERIRNGEDLHWRHASGFMGWDYEMLDRGRSRGKGSYEDKCRQAFKTLYFAGGYGAGPGKLADTVRDDFYRIGIERDVVRSMLSARKASVGRDLYISLARAWGDWIASEYPVLKASFNRIVMDIGKTTTVVGKFAIERRLPEIWDPDEQIQSEAGRQGYNFRPQNLSLLTFIAYRELVPIRRDLGAEDEILLALQEHDSLLWLAKEEHAALWDVVAKSKMENIDWSEWGTSFAVPLTVESYIGDHWG